MRHRSHEDDGFTLLELMFVVLVLGILVSIAVSSYAASSDRSLRVTCHENLRLLDTAVAVYEQQHTGFPASLADLEPQVKGRSAFHTCPQDETPYVYDDITGRIECPNHPL